MIFSAVVYAWRKSDTNDFLAQKIDIRPELNPHMFVSGNGKLYFSEVTGVTDNGYYYCIVTLTLQNINQDVISTHGAPSRTSNPVQLSVATSGKWETKNVIWNSLHVRVLPK